MPFLTEELWHRLGHDSSIALERYPQFSLDDGDLDAAERMQQVQGTIATTRFLKADQKLDKSQKVSVDFYSVSPAYEVVRDHAEEIQVSTNTEFVFHNEEPPAGLTGAIRSTPHFTVRIAMHPSPDQGERLKKENEQLEKVIANSKRQLQDTDFMQKAPITVRSNLEAKLVQYEAQLAKNKAALGE
jgi:valyl-tRNA synthetase